MARPSVAQEREEGARRLTPAQQVYAVLPFVALALVAIACLVSAADWKGDGARRTALEGLGASEETASSQAVETAAHIYPDKITAKNPPVDPKLLDEVQKAEKEQAKEMQAESEFAKGKDTLKGGAGKAGKDTRSHTFDGAKAPSGASVAGKK